MADATSNPNPLNGQEGASPVFYSVGVDFKVRYLSDKNVKLTIWDTAGQERFRTLTSSYYRSADAAILVFDVNNRQSFEELRTTWWPELQQQIANSTKRTNVVYALVGNKIDLGEGSRQVLENEAIWLAQECKAMYLECSAASDWHVEDLFGMIIDRVLQARASVASSLSRQPSSLSEDHHDYDNSLRGKGERVRLRKADPDSQGVNSMIGGSETWNFCGIC